MVENSNFQKMWEAHAMGVMAGETVAFNFSAKNNYKNLAKLQEKNAVFFYKKSTGTQFFNSVKELKSSSEYGFKRFNNEAEVQNYLKKSKESMTRADKEYRDFIKINLKSESKKELLSIFKRLLDVYQQVYTFYHTCQPQYFSKIEEYIKTKLGKKYSSKIANEIYSALTLSEELDPLTIEEIEWLEIVNKVKSKYPDKEKIELKDLNEEIKEAIQKHSDKYIYLGTVETSIPWDINHYLYLLNKEIKSDVCKKLREIRNKKQQLSNRKNKIIKERGVDKKLIDLCSTLAKIGLNRLNMRFRWTKISYLWIKILEEIVDRNINSLLNKEYIWEFKLEELEDAILNQKYISEKELKRRKEAFLFNVEEEKINFYSGNEAIKMKEKLIPEEDFSKIKELRGQIGCKGKYKGKVYLFSWLEENLTKKIDDMERGGILVAGQTRPFLMPVIRKAGAIVTDEGGITSHAAIVSRELNIPCVIGTKIATKVLHDGDLIEVDADNGIIKILEKKK